MKTLLRSLILFLITILLFHTLAILFGAPLLTRIKETFFFAVVLSLCSASPSIFFISSWQDFFRVHFDSTYLNYKERTIAVLAKFSILGAWLGAFPIPLDWDRWWQEWPITCVAGCVAGFVLGFLYTRLFPYRRSKHSADLPFKPKSV